MAHSRTRTVLLVGWGSFLMCMSGNWSLPTGLAASPPQSPAPSPGPAQTSPGTGRAQTLSLQERADIYMARKAYADAVDYYLRALKQGGYSDAVVWNKLGIAYQQQIDYRGARRAYGQAIKHDLHYAEPLNNLGTTYYMQNKFSKSVKYYLRALKISPTSASFHLNLGTSYYRMKKYAESVEEYRTALSLDPSILLERSPVGTVVQARGADPEYYYYLAKVFASLGRPEEAVRYLRHAFEDGFKDQKKVEEDPDFQKIAQNPAFIELMKNRPVAIKD